MGRSVSTIQILYLHIRIGSIIFPQISHNSGKDTPHVPDTVSQTCQARRKLRIHESTDGLARVYGKLYFVHQDCLYTHECVGVPPFLTPTSWCSNYPPKHSETDVSIESLFNFTSYGTFRSRDP